MMSRVVQLVVLSSDSSGTVLCTLWERKRRLGDDVSLAQCGDRRRFLRLFAVFAFRAACSYPVTPFPRADSDAGPSSVCQSPFCCRTRGTALRTQVTQQAYSKPFLVAACVQKFGTCEATVINPCLFFPQQGAGPQQARST